GWCETRPYGSPSLSASARRPSGAGRAGEDGEAADRAAGGGLILQGQAVERPAKQGPTTALPGRDFSGLATRLQHAGRVSLQGGYGRSSMLGQADDPGGT